MSRSLAPLLSLTVAVPLGAALSLPLTAWAGPDGGSERPATWDMSLDELQDVGLGQYRGDPVPVPADAPLQAEPTGPVEAKQGVIFVNFDGAQLVSGYDDSRVNKTQIGNLVGSFAAYGAGSKRDAVMQAVRDDWSAFNVVVVDARPGSGDYTMNMTGPTNPYGGGVLGIAPLDCNDSQTHNNITYAFHSANDSHSASTTATTVGQEVAHSYGLEHVNEPGDIMNPYNAGGDPSFRDECIQIVNGGNCASQHAAECGSGTSQNSFAELMTLFGPSAPDNSPPDLNITYPVDGEEFEAGASFDITVDATDDNSMSDVQLYINGVHEETDTDAPYGWGVSGIPEGTYELYVIGSDLAGNEAMSNVISIGVGGASATTGNSPTGGSGSGTGGSDSDSGSGGSESAGTTDDTAGSDTAATSAGWTTDGLPPGFGEEDRDVGCACTSAPLPPAAGLMLLALAGTLRRRRE